MCHSASMSYVMKQLIFSQTHDIVNFFFFKSRHFISIFLNKKSLQRSYHIFLMGHIIWWPLSHWGRDKMAAIFKCIFLNENAQISLKKSLKFVPTVWINNIPAMVLIMAWRWSGDKPLSEPMVVSLLTHICVTRPQWVIVVAILVPCHNAVSCLSNSFEDLGDWSSNKLQQICIIYSLAPGRFQRNFRKVTFQLILVIDVWSIS